MKASPSRCSSGPQSSTGTRAGDHAGLLRHARVYVGALLDQGKDADALALF